MSSSAGAGPTRTVRKQPALDVANAPERPVRRVGKYRILSELGRGGMANVFLAVAQGPGGVNKLVVLKALLPELSAEPDALAMFLDEARLAARLNHANVVQTYEVGTEGDRHVIVMEYLEGQSFSSVLKRTELAGQTLSVAMYLRVVINALEGLHYAHELCDYDGSTLALVHRDVSPQNIFLTYDGQVKVLDFGIAKAATSSTNTATGVVKGKIAYMSPEQMIGDGVDRRADLYSVGCMLWAAATGKKLWKDTPDVHIMRRVINAETPSPQSVAAGCDDELNRITMKALASDRDERYATALELQSDLERYCESFSAVVKQKDIGNYVTTLFADTRAELKAVVERQLTLVTDANDHEELSRSAVRGWPTAAAEGASVAADADANPSQARAATRRSRLVSAGAALGGAALLGLGFYAFRTPAPSPGALTPTASDKLDAPSRPAVEELATVRLQAVPSNARLFLDEKPLVGNPTSTTLPLDGSPRLLRAEADGYESATSTFVATRDRRVELVLRQMAPVAAVSAAATAGPNKVRTQAPKAQPALGKVPATAPEEKPRAACEQPFFVGPDGIRKLRPECM